MKKANLSHHAKIRIGERCSLSEAEIIRILDEDGSVVIHLQKGGRYAHRLIYSVPDEEWFMVVQDGGNGGVLTVMPLEFLVGRTPVTAAHKRLARSRAIALSKPEQPPPPTPAKSIPVAPVPVQHPLPGWRINVYYKRNGCPNSKKVPGRTPESFGNPEEWQETGPIHHWMKCQLLALSIPLTAVTGFTATRGKVTKTVDCLLEQMPLTDFEIAQFR